jgi:hypothetical protein
LDEDALCKISPYVDRNEASLHVFGCQSRPDPGSRKRCLFAPAAELSSPVGVGFIGTGSIVEENTARGYRHGNREAKKPKKLKPKEIAPSSMLASIQKKALEVDIEAQPPKLGPFIDTVNAALSDPSRLGKS